MGVSRDCPNFVGSPVIRETVKTTDLTFTGTFRGSIGTKARNEKWGE